MCRDTLWVIVDGYHSDGYSTGADCLGLELNLEQMREIPEKLLATQRAAVPAFLEKSSFVFI